MNQIDAKAQLVSQLNVTRQMVTIAKANLLKLAHSEAQTDVLISRFLREIGAVMPEIIILHPQVDPLPTIEKAAESISWSIAASEALLELIHSSLVIPAASDTDAPSNRLKWTTVYRECGGTSGDWNFKEYSFPIPRKVSIPLSRSGDHPEFLVNPDLYLVHLDIDGLHSEVALSLREAVRCFRQDLFVAAVAMLGRAVEGAWLDLGEALLAFLNSSDVKIVARQKAVLESPMDGIGKKIGAVVAIYERQDLYGPLAEQSHISIQELKASAAWSDTVRDSRNTIHFGVKPSLPNTYEKVAALLLGAVPHLRAVYALITASRKQMLCA